MDSPNISVRALRDDDLGPLSRIIAKTWYDDVGADEALPLAADLLAMHLSLSTWAVVAEGAGMVLGCCFARLHGHETGTCANWEALEQRTRHEAAKVSISLAGNRELDEDEHALLDEVESELGHEGVGYLQLLIVSADARGMGVGAGLMEAGKEYLRSGGCTRYRLTTDEACDVALYDHLGLDLLAKRTSPAMAGRSFYIYVYEGRL